jgi:hypothetical protein
VAATYSIRVVKQFLKRGAIGTYSNRYHIGTAGPADSGHWTTFSDAIVAAEKACFVPLLSGGAKIVQTIGYAAGSEVPVFTKTYAVDGTSTFSVYFPAPSDVAALVRYSTPDRSTKNHPVYCFNYYHGIGLTGTSLNTDLLNSAQATAFSTYGTAWVAGFSDGTTTFHRSRPTGDLCTGVFVNPLVTHRDLPR